jgi:hypothetical protein
MGSSGKKKTTMAKLARENRLRERRLNKQAKKDARRQVASDRLIAPEATTPGAVEESRSVGPEDEAAVAGHDDEAGRAFLDVESEPSDPRAKEVALTRLRDSRDEELAVFEDKLRDGALNAGATEQELREAQRDHPGHGG